MADKVATNIRIDGEVLKQIDARAHDVGISRAQWIENCTRWAIHNLPHGASGRQVRETAQNAPADIAGTYSVDMGLDSPDGRT